MGRKIVGWVIGQQISEDSPLPPEDEDRFRFGFGLDYTMKPYEVYWCGGGSKRLGSHLVRVVHGKLYRGPYPKFVRNDIAAAIFSRRETAEHVALMLTITEPSLVGRLYVTGTTNLGVPKG